jgi:hypothetical protein
MKASLLRRLAPLCLAAIALGAVACNDVGDSTGLPGPSGEGGQDGTLQDGTFQEGGGEAGDDGSLSSDAPNSSEAGSDAEGSDAASADESQEASGGSGDDAPSTESGSEGTESGSDAMEAATTDAGSDATAPEAGPEAGPDAADGGLDSGLHDAETEASSPDASDGGGLVPCTTAGQTGCVQCHGNGGVCSPTAARLVQIDINKGVATAPGPAPTDNYGSTCYSCTYNAFCLDGIGGQTGYECQDLAGNFTNGAGASVNAESTCLATLDCVLSPTQGQGCVNSANGIDQCYCGVRLEPQ